MSKKNTSERMIQFRIPSELALKYEVEASLEGLSLAKYCKKKVLGNDANQTNDKILEIHKMVSYLFHKSS